MGTAPKARGVPLPMDGSAATLDSAAPLDLLRRQRWANALLATSIVVVTALGVVDFLRDAPGAPLDVALATALAVAWLLNASRRVDAAALVTSLAFAGVLIARPTATGDARVLPLYLPPVALLMLLLLPGRWRAFAVLGSLAIWTTLVAVTSPARTPALTRLDLVLNAAIVTVSTLLLSLVTLRETRRLVRASYRERDRARAAAATYEKTRRDLNSLVTARTAHLQSVLTETEELIEELSRTAMRDHLTGLYNRRYLDEELPRQIAVAERRRRPLSVVLLDLVNFKQVNDDFSHATGDQVLTQTAGVLAEQLQPEEVIARFGGDEFIVLLPDSLPSDAAARVEEFRRALAATDFEVAPGRRIDVRAGISIWSPKGGTGADATRTTAQHSEAASDLLAAAAADLGARRRLQPRRPND